jgi:hypothetical protein
MAWDRREREPAQQDKTVSEHMVNATMGAERLRKVVYMHETGKLVTAAWCWW